MALSRQAPGRDHDREPGTTSVTRTDPVTRRRFLAASAALPLAALACRNSATAGERESHSLRIRRNVTSLSRTDKKKLVEAFLKIKAEPSPFDIRLGYYDQFVAWYLLAQSCSKLEHADTPWACHLSPATFPWHRIFLRLFERRLESVAGERLALPYWDWTDPASLDVVFAEDFLGPLRGDPKQQYVVTTGPFRKDAWEMTIRSAPSDDPGQSHWLVRAGGLIDGKVGLRLPTAGELADAQMLKDYDVAPFDITSNPDKSFRARIDGVYGYEDCTCSGDGVDALVPGPAPKPPAMCAGVQHFVAGSFKIGEQRRFGTLKTCTAPNDPVFWLHRAFLDKVWADWLLRHGRDYQPEKPIRKPGHRGGDVPGLHTPLKPFHRVLPDRCTAAALLDHQGLGYAYDTDKIER